MLLALGVRAKRIPHRSGTCIFRVLSQSSKSFEIGRNPLNYQNFLFNIANVDCLVERSGNERGLPRLEPKLRDKLLLASTVDPRALRKRWSSESGRRNPRGVGAESRVLLSGSEEVGAHVIPH